MFLGGLGVFQWTARRLCLQLNSQTSLARAIDSPTDFTNSLDWFSPFNSLSAY